MVSKQWQRSLRRCSCDDGSFSIFSQSNDSQFKFRNGATEIGDFLLLSHTATPAQRSARRSWFFFPRGQPYLACWLCWLVSPPNRRDAFLPVAVPLPGPALGCFCACAWDVSSFGIVTPMTPRATRPRVTPPLTTSLPRFIRTRSVHH